MSFSQSPVQTESQYIEIYICETVVSSLVAHVKL